MINCQNFIYFQLYFLFIFLLIGNFSYSQNEVNKDSINKIKISIPESSIIDNIYDYDPMTDMYYLSKSIGGYPINYPLVLSPKEYEKWILKQDLKIYTMAPKQLLQSEKQNQAPLSLNIFTQKYVHII